MLPFFGGWLKPVPAPDSTNELDNNKINEGGSNQNEILFKRGNQCNVSNLLPTWTMSSSNTNIKIKLSLLLLYF
jgi:hypothetical protein